MGYYGFGCSIFGKEYWGVVEFLSRRSVVCCACGGEGFCDRKSCLCGDWLWILICFFVFWGFCDVLGDGWGGVVYVYFFFLGRVLFVNNIVICYYM